MTVFLTPSLRPFFGGTYLPHEQFLQAIRGGAEQFRTDRSAVESRGAEIYARIAAQTPSDPAAVLELSELRAIARQSLSNVDATFGGFRGRTKFPTPIKWKFLLHAYRKWGDEDIAHAIRKTLDALSDGGIRSGGAHLAREPLAKW